MEATTSSRDQRLALWQRLAVDLHDEGAADFLDGQPVRGVGTIGSVELHENRKEEPWAQFRADFGHGTYACLVFPQVFRTVAGTTQLDGARADVLARASVANGEVVLHVEQWRLV